MESGQLDPLGVRNDFAGAQVVGSVLQAGVVKEIHQHFAAEAPLIIPRQLPPAPTGFVNRVDQLSQLGALLEATADGCPVVVLSGLGGVGKTGLGVHWAHRATPWFSGGQLYADLRAARHQGGVDIADIMAGFLRSLGVRDEWIPGGLAERRGLFRSILADRSVLIMLDNVADPAEAEPFFPASPGSMVLVTSRHRLAGLIVNGATPMPLPPLADAEGVELLQRMLSSDRVARDGGVILELVRHCGGLPIALRVCGARLVGRRGRGIRKLSSDLADEHRRLSQLSAGGTPIVEAIFDAAYATLEPDSARLYRGLGLHPGPTFSAEVMAVVVGTDEGQALDVAESLVEANLLEEVDEDHYRFHDLVRLHAAAQSDVDPGKTDIRRRILAWYLERAQAADWAIMGPRLRVADTMDTAVTASPFADSAAALAWMQTERANLIAAVRTATQERFYDLVWQLVEALWVLYDSRPHHADELESARLGLQAAQVTQNQVAEAKMRNQLVRALLRDGDVRAALQEAGPALDHALSLKAEGEQARLVRRVQSMLIETHGFVLLAQQDLEAAISAFERSRTINAEVNNPRGVGLQTLHIAIALRAAGRADAAAEELTAALETMAGIGDEFSQAKIGIELGETWLELGRRTEAASVLTTSLSIMARRDQTGWQVRALEALAEATDDADVADECRQAVRTIRLAGGDTG